MSDVLLKPAFVSAAVDTGDATKLGPNGWNAARLFSGGVNGDIITRDTAAATGASWGPAPVAVTRTVNGHALSGDVVVTKSDVGLSAVENTALSTWAGSANLTTLGPVLASSATLLTLGTVAEKQVFFDNATGYTAFGEFPTPTAANAIIKINPHITDASVSFGINVAPSYDVSGNECTGLRVSQALAPGVAKANGAGLVVEVPVLGAGASIGSAGYFSGLFRGAHGSTGIVKATTLGLESSADETLWIALDTQPTTPQGGIVFGSAKDTNLYRSAAGQLTTDGKMRFTGAIGVIGTPNASAAISIGTSQGTPSSGAISRVIYNLATIPATTTSTAYGYTSQPLTAASAFTLSDYFHWHCATIAIGAGSAVTNQWGLRIDALTTAATNIGAAIAKASTQTLWLSYATQDTTKEGGIAFGSAKDTVLYRSAVSTLKTDNALVALLVNRTKAGTPVDGDVITPADGMLIVDTTASKIWVRIGGVWKGVVVA